MTPKRQARLWNQVGKGKKKKKEREKKMREPESFWNQVEVKEKKEEERMRELLESGSKEKEKGEDVLRDNGIRVWWTKCKRKKKKKRKRKHMDERKVKN